MKTFLALLLSACLPVACVSQCTRHGQSMAEDGWSKQLRRVCFWDGVESNRFPSPDGRKVLIADLHGFHLKVDGALIPWSEGRKLLTTESEVLWSPTSSAFFINDGYGIDGWKLEIYDLADNLVTSHEEINKEIVLRFRAEMKCSTKTYDPNVRGLGWSEDGILIFAFAQATVNERCGGAGSYRGIVASLTGDPVGSFYSEAETRRRFHHLLPYNMR